MTEVGEWKAESRLEMDVYLRGRCGPEMGYLAMVVVHDFEQSVPGA